MDRFSYSVVIPVFNSEKIVAKTVNQTETFFARNGFEYSIILINDGSSDNSWGVIQQLARRNERITAVNLLKNYGQHNAILCGFRFAKGDFVITIDDDLQNPPDEIIHLIKKIHEGYDCVFGKFKTKKHTWLRRIGSRLVNYLNHKIFDKPRDITLSNFRIVTISVVKRIVEYRTGFPYIQGLLMMFSNKIANVEVEHHSREIGKSNYSVYKLLQLVFRLVVNYSSIPLRVLTVFGIVISTFSFLVGIATVVWKLFFDSSTPGWTSLVALLSFLNGFTILMLGFIGEYVSRILRQISSLDSYHIKEIIGPDPANRTNFDGSANQNRSSSVRMNNLFQHD